jgi:hypothetical protein
MTEATETNFPFFARINPGIESQVLYWAEKFSISPKELVNIIQLTGPVVKDIHDYLQTLRPAYTPYMNHNQLIASYKAFVDATVKNYLEDFKAYTAKGGEDSFYKRCWWVMMNETVEEADRILRQYGQQVDDATKLSKDLQQIASDRLLHINEFVSV